MGPAIAPNVARHEHGNLGRPGHEKRRVPANIEETRVDEPIVVHPVWRQLVERRPAVPGSRMVRATSVGWTGRISWRYFGADSRPEVWVILPTKHRARAPGSGRGARRGVHTGASARHDEPQRGCVQPRSRLRTKKSAAQGISSGTFFVVAVSRGSDYTSSLRTTSLRETGMAARQRLDTCRRRSD